MVALGLFHTPIEDIVFRGYTIPAGALVIPDVVSISTDPEIWTDPDVFRPDRFLDEKGHVIKREEDTPFFIGTAMFILVKLFTMYAVVLWLFNNMLFHLLTECFIHHVVK